MPGAMPDRQRRIPHKPIVFVGARTAVEDAAPAARLIPPVKAARAESDRRGANAFIAVVHRESLELIS